MRWSIENRLLDDVWDMELREGAAAQVNFKEII